VRKSIIQMFKEERGCRGVCQSNHGAAPIHRVT
jgi:hypothetical protein